MPSSCTSSSTTLIYNMKLNGDLDELSRKWVGVAAARAADVLTRRLRIARPLSLL